MSAVSLEVVVYELLRARLEGDEPRAHLLVEELSREELRGVVQGLADVALSSLTEALRASGHPDPEGWVRDFLERMSGAAVDDAVRAQVGDEPPLFHR